MRVYVTLQPDYYDKTYKLEEYKKALRDFAYAKSYRVLCVTGTGFSTASKVMRLWQFIKSLLGFENYTSQRKVEYELLKFLHYGIVQQYTHNADVITLLKDINKRFEQKELTTSDKITKAFQHIIQNCTHQNYGVPPAAPIQSMLIDHFHTHWREIRPSFFNRIRTATIAVPDTFYFGDTVLALAERSVIASASFEKPNISKKFEYYIQAASIDYAQNIEYTKRVALSLKKAINSLNYIEYNFNFPQQVFSVYAALAHRYYIHGQYKKAHKYFSKADTKNSPLTPTLLVLWAHSCIKTANFAAAHQVKKRVTDKKIVLFPKVHIEINLALASHIVKNRETIATKTIKAVSIGLISPKAPYDNCREAIKLYEEALKLEKNTEEQYQILEKIQHTVSLIKKAHSIRSIYFQKALELSEEAKTELALHYLLIALQYFNKADLLTSNAGRQAFSLFVRLIQEHNRTEKPEISLKLINYALHAIGDISNFLTPKYKWHGLSKEIESYTSTVPELLNSNGQFQIDVGAKLHFLKAQLLTKIGSHNSQEIANEYKLAYFLAPNNPFGAEALFLEDAEEQKTAPDNFTDLAKTYEALASQYL